MKFHKIYASLAKFSQVKCNSTKFMFYWFDEAYQGLVWWLLDNLDSCSSVLDVKGDW